MDKKLLTINIATILLTSCSMFSNNSQAQTIPAPPQKVSQKDAKAVIANRNSGMSQRSKNIANELEEDKEKEEHEPRIQEDRDPNGVVEEIRVKNKNLPPYYIYPSQQQNWGITQIPDQNISTPNWQIRW